MMSKSDDLYEILQVHHAAEPEVIEAAYRRLLRMYHPDVNKTAQAHDITVRLNAAYEVLRDPAKRAEYDHQRDSQTGYDRGQRQAEQEQTKQTEDLLNKRLIQAIKDSNIELIRTLLERGANVNLITIGASLRHS